jgi:hypothetical protein
MLTRTAAQMAQLYQDAEVAVLASQSFNIAGRLVTLADLPEIRKGRSEWERRARAEVDVQQGRSFGHALAVFARG